MYRGKAHIKNQVLLLRQDGYSYELIKQKTGVSKSTLSDWLHNLPYTPNDEVKKRMLRGQLKSAKTLRGLRINRILKTKEISKHELGKVTKRDLMLLGIGLYIGEGSKYDRGFIQFSNSDPKVIKLAMSWFTKILNVGINNFYLIVHCYPDNNVDKIIKFWSDLTNVPIYQFEKTYIDRRTNKSARNKRKLKHGTLHVRIRGLTEKFAREAIYQKVLAWIEIVENYNFAGIV